MTTYDDAEHLSIGISYENCMIANIYLASKDYYYSQVNFWNEAYDTRVIEENEENIVFISLRNEDERQMPEKYDFPFSDEVLQKYKYKLQHSEDLIEGIEVDFEDESNNKSEEGISTSRMSAEEIYEKLVAYYKQGTPDAPGDELTVMEGTFDGDNEYWTTVRCGVPGNPSASQMLYDITVNSLTGDVVQTRVLIDNQVVEFNLNDVSIVENNSSEFWRDVYYEFVSNTKGQNDRYHLLYLNDDDIPELYIIKDGSKGKTIYTYSEKGMTSIELGTGDIKYHDRENILDHFSYGYKGSDLDQYYSIENGEFKLVATALNPYDYENSEFYGKYAWDYTEVSEDIYNSKRNELFSPNGAIEILEFSDDGWCASSGGWMTYDEILDYLSAKSEMIELRAYTAFPESSIGTNQEVKIQFSLYVNGDLNSIEQYTLGISNPSVVESIETVDSNGSRIITFKGLNPGISDIAFTESSTGATITISVQVNDKCNYFRCSAFPIPYESSGSIYISDYSCSVDENGNHDIVFNAYNTSYSYGVVEIYDKDGSLIKLVPLDPRSDSTGMEKVVNGFKWVWEDIKDLFDGDTPFYIKDSNAKHTPVKLDNIPVDAEIIITSDGEISDFVTLYTGVDVFVRTVFAALSIDLKTDGQVATVKELMTALTDSLIKSISNDEVEKTIKQGLVKEATETISTSIAFASSADSISDIYETIYNLFKSLDIDAESIMLNVLKGMGYSVADTAFTTIVPLYKIVNFVDQILETAWPLTDYRFNLERGKIEIHASKHGLHNFITNNSVIITQRNNFSENVVLDAYVVTKFDELEKISDTISAEMIDYVIYNITLREDGVEVQPDEEIEVCLPISDDMDERRCAVYRIEENGEKILLSSSVRDGYIKFTTSHLSYYIIGEMPNEIISYIKIFLTITLITGVCLISVGVVKRKNGR